MDKVVAKVMQTNKVVKLFQTMAIVNLNTGSLNLEVSSLKNILATEEKEKAILQVELDKEKDFHREYKHNIEIWKKNMTKNEQKIKALIQKLQDENKELKANILYTLIPKGFVVKSLSQNNFRHSL
jgi:chromosome segregation ATPase